MMIIVMMTMMDDHDDKDDNKDEKYDDDDDDTFEVPEVLRTKHSPLKADENPEMIIIRESI